MDDAAFLRALPKAEIHIHIEGTLEPEMMFRLAGRNGVRLPFDDVGQIRAAYEFDSLQTFLDIYYQGADVLRTEQDFHELMAAYLERVAGEGVRRAEIFFDPQTHTRRGIPFGAFMDGFAAAQEEAASRSGISSALIMCFLRHLPAEDAMATLSEGLGFRDRLLGVGLDSSEVGNPPERFADVFARARAEGLRITAHAGEEGPPAYVWGALDALGAERIEHGVRAVEDPALVDRLVDEQIPLTMCPLSNVKLRVFDRLADHTIGRLLERGVNVSVNSDDPAYFGGYVADNYVAVAAELELGRDSMVRLAGNSLRSTFLPQEAKHAFLAELESYAGS